MVARNVHNHNTWPYPNPPLPYLSTPLTLYIIGNFRIYHHNGFQTSSKSTLSHNSPSREVHIITGDVNNILEGLEVQHQVVIRGKYQVDHP